MVLSENAMDDVELSSDDSSNEVWLDCLIAKFK